MAQGSRICPNCGRLNGAGEARCYSCGRRLPGPWVASLSSLWDEVLGRDFTMTKILWGLSIIMFAACVAVDQRLPLGFGLNLGGPFRMSTLLRFGELSPGLVAISDEPWRLFSAVFLHANVMHIAFNSMALVDLGRIVEGEFKAARFAVLFVLSGVLGFVASVWWSDAPTLGASGGVFGLIGAIGVIAFVRRDAFYRALFNRLLVYGAVMFLLPMPINNAAHLGGLVAGAAISYLFELDRTKLRLSGPMLVLAILVLLASVASLAISTRSPVWKVVRVYELQHE